MSDHTSFGSLVDVLQSRSRGKGSITFIQGQGNHQQVRFADLYERARQRLACFQSGGVKPGHQMIIQCGDNSQFLEAFWACLLGGVVAVPIAGGNSAEHRHKLFRIAGNLDSPWLFIDDAAVTRMDKFAAESDLSDEWSQLQAATFVAGHSLDSRAVALLANPEPHDTAFIQFSSGSTSTPKGIVLTHHNLLCNTASIIEGCLMTPQDHLLSWMPLTHDMGLIGFHLTPLLCNASHSLIPTDVFVRRPAIWLSESQAMQATIVCSPNFGYQHLLKSFKPERHTNLDLSSIRLLFNGAEPISVPLCQEFMETLAPFGLHSNAMIPVYGLAEASLAVTFPALDQRFTTLTLDRASLTPGTEASILPEAHEGVQFVSVGKPVARVEVMIRDEHGATCAERVTGRICIRGPNVTKGYYRQPKLNAQMIDGQGWLDTGDLGFLFQEQLYITGRAKDVIFVNGQNVYPHDLEEILIQKNLLERGKLALASQSVDGQTAEQLLVFVMHRGDASTLESLAHDITRTLSTDAGIRVDAVVAVPRIPKTTSGKVQRFQLLQDYSDGQFSECRPTLEERLDTVSEDEPLAADDVAVEDPAARDSTASRLLDICNTAIEGLQVNEQDNLFELGISSLTLAEIHAAIEDTWPGEVEITDLFDYPTVAELALFLDAKARTDAPESA